MTQANKKSEEFIGAIKVYINYWERQNGTVRENMEGLAFSILVMLDGCSGSFGGNIETLSKENICFHELFTK